MRPPLFIPPAALLIVQKYIERQFSSAPRERYIGEVVLRAANL